MNLWAAWGITGGLAVAIPQAQQLARWWSSDEPTDQLTARRLRLRRGKLLESTMNVPMLFGLLAILVGGAWQTVLIVVAIPVGVLWALQIHVRKTGMPAALTPPFVRPRAGERA
ncbi:MAG: hypothetical protein ACR2HC_05145 [Thermoleophilaceae bacterium]